MSEAFKWNLSPTERRIAEMAFAARGEQYSVSAAVRAVLRLRGLVQPFDKSTRDAWCSAMLAELRSEPSHPCDEHDYRIQRLVEGANTHRERAERYRALLDRIVLAGHSLEREAVMVDVRAELAR